MNDKVTKLPAQPERLQIAFQLGETTIDSVVIRSLTFSSFSDCITAALAMTEPKAFESRLRRLRLMRQVTYYSGTNPVQVSSADILKMPIPAVRSIIARLDENEGVAGKITRDGDGIDKAIVYELGTPVQMLAGQGRTVLIKELEFQASTYGDIEDVMAVDSTIQQAALLISTIAKPLGTSLSRLPSSALTQITVADGVTISRDILPRFLGSPVE